MRIVFLGSPKEVIAPLQTLLSASTDSDIDLVGVISQPPRPAGRKRQLTDPPLATFAKEAGLKVLQPESARDPQFLKDFRSLEPDVAITAAYGQILNEEFLSIPKRATINLHPSLLPLYRGATPVQSALLDGATETGVTILFTVRALDAGAIISQNRVEVSKNEATDTLLPRLFKIAGEMLPDALDKLRDPTFVGTPQDEAKVTHCTKVHKNDGAIDWHSPSEEIVNRFRAFKPWPGSFTYLGDRRLLMTDLEQIEGCPTLKLAPGEAEWSDAMQVLAVGTGDGLIGIRHLKPAGSKEQHAKSFWNGLSQPTKVLLSSESESEKVPST